MEPVEPRTMTRRISPAYATARRRAAAAGARPRTALARLLGGSRRRVHGREAVDHEGERLAAQLVRVGVLAVCERGRDHDEHLRADLLTGERLHESGHVGVTGQSERFAILPGRVEALAVGPVDAVVLQQSGVAVGDSGAL